MCAVTVKLDGVSDSAFARCREVVRAGGVIAYPTDTLYGLGADPKNPRAVRSVFEIKGRNVGQPILLLLYDRAEVASWVSAVTPSAELLMRKFWPGPLTLVFTARPEVLQELTGGTGTIGLRVPGNDLTRSLLRFLGTALTGTSANRAGGPGPRTAEEVMRAVGERIELILDGGASPEERPSTIIDVTTEPPRVIREGAIDISEMLV